MTFLRIVILRCPGARTVVTFIANRYYWSCRLTVVMAVQLSTSGGESWD